MDRIKLGQLPLLAKIAIAITFYNAFVLFEEFVIDRRGWYRYLPWYKYHQFCAWDFAAIALILTLIFGGGAYAWHKLSGGRRPD